MTRVIHTGDTHIGYRQYNAPERRRDFLDAFEGVIDDAIEDDVEAVVHAGDLFHDRRPGLVDLQGTVEILGRLADATIPFLAVVGNHEGKRDAQWLDLFADIGLATRLGSSPQVVDQVALYGLDFVPRSKRSDLSYEFEPVPSEAEYAVLVSHGLFEPFAHADWDTERLLEESTVEFDAVLLGDNHTPDTAEVLDTWVTYCGSTERASASERDARGYNLISFPDDGTADVSITRRSLTDTREFVFVDVDLGPDEGIDRVRNRIREYDVDDAVVIVTLEGDGRPITPAAVEEFAMDRGALVARVNDRRDVADEDDDLSVSFADPDDAVRERIRELGLSSAALEIDTTVRNDDLADANVRETVERRVRELVDGDQSAFDPAPESELESKPAGTSEIVGEDDPGVGDSDGSETDDESTAVDRTEETETDTDEKTSRDTENVSTADTEDETAEETDEGSVTDTEDETAEDSDDGSTDTQHASLGDFA